MTTEEAIVGKLRKLHREQQRRVLAFVEGLGVDETPRSQRRVSKGMWSGLGVDVSEEDTVTARREM